MKKLIILLTFLSFSVFAEPVDINKASAKEIAASLQGVGEKKSQAIVDYREENGPFKSINDLNKVKGIYKKIIENNKSNIKLKYPKKAKS